MVTLPSSLPPGRYTWLPTPPLTVSALVISFSEVSKLAVLTTVFLAAWLAMAWFWAFSLWRAAK